jgi:hypothetical protein
VGTYLSDGHGAEDVEEDEGAVGEVGAHEVAMGDAVQPGDGHKRQLGDHAPIKSTANNLHHTCCGSATYVRETWYLVCQ